MGGYGVRSTAAPFTQSLASDHSRPVLGGFFWCINGVKCTFLLSSLWGFLPFSTSALASMLHGNWHGTSLIY